MDEQFDNIARYLDGEQVELTDEQRRLADEIRADEASLSGALDVEMPARAMRNVRRRIADELAPPRGRRRLFYRVATSAAIAASILLATALLLRLPNPTQTNPETRHGALAAVEFIEPLQDQTDIEIALLAGDVERLEQEVLLDSGPEVEEMELESLERDVDEFWLDQAAPMEVLLPSS